MGTPQLPRPPAIDAISRLADLEITADQFRQQKGYSPEIISHWDPKAEFASRIEPILTRDRPPHGSLLNYVYSGYLGVDKRIRVRLQEGGDRGLLLTPSGTTSIVNIIAYLKNISCSHLHIIAPCYFAVESCAMSFGIRTTFSQIVRGDGEYFLPKYDTKMGAQVIWLTFPIYGASCYCNPEHIANYIDKLPENIIVVIDDGLAFLDRSGLLMVKTAHRVIRIVTPHKAICVNGEKVSIVTFPPHLSDDIDAWSECFAGGIGAGGARALQFLGSESFDAAVDETRKVISENLSRMKRIFEERPSVSLDKSPDGHFVMVYWPSIPMTASDSGSFMKNLIGESGCLPIPASRNRHPEHYGFSFRVNLLRLDDAGLGGLSRLADALDRRA